MILFICVLTILFPSGAAAQVTIAAHAEIKPRQSAASMVDDNVGDFAQEKRAKVAASLLAYQKTFDDVEAFIDEVHRSDHMVKGFEQPAITSKEWHLHLKELKRDERKQALEMEHAQAKRIQDMQSNPVSLEEARSQALMKTMTTYDGKRAVVSGFWAQERPDEERIDPDNMRIYKYTGFAKRFPFKHSWEVEVLWKKLPLAPKRVHKVKYRHAGQFVSTSFVDEDGQHLVYTKDPNGFYHLGDQVTKDDIERAARPVDYQNMLQAREEQKENEGLELYTDHRQEFESLMQKVKHGDKYARANAAFHLELLRHEMRNKLQAKARRHGKAWVSVRGAHGIICSFNAEVGQVTVSHVKQHIEHLTQIPAEAQILTVNGAVLNDNDLLNKHLVAGIGNWINLRKKGWPAVKKALIQRGKIEAPSMKLLKTNDLKTTKKHEDQAIETEEDSRLRHMTEAEREKKALQDMNMRSVAKADRAVIRALRNAKHVSAQHETLPASLEQAAPKKHVLRKSLAAKNSFLEVGLKDVKIHYGTLEKLENDKVQHSSARGTDTAAGTDMATGSGRVTRKIRYVRDDHGEWHIEKTRKRRHAHEARHDDKDSLLEDASTDAAGIPLEQRLSLNKRLPNGICTISTLRCVVAWLT